MFRIKGKDLALVAFAGGMLTIELVGLRAAAPAALRTLAGVTGLPQVKAVSRSARAASESMLNGFTAAAAHAAVAGVQAVGGTAERVVAATPIPVERRAVRAPSQCGFRHVMVVRNARSVEVPASTRLASWQNESCRADLRVIQAETRAERAHRRAEQVQKRAERARRAIEAVSEAAAL